MKLLVDAHLPRHTAEWFRAEGHDAIHTLDLPLGNKTSDADILSFAEAEGRTVVTKDADFVDSHLLRGKPASLLLISTGNITNRELEMCLRPLVTRIAVELETNSFLELHRDGLIVRG